MKASATVKEVFSCSLERAFQAPILGDATRFLNGYLLQPPVIRFEEDETWGQVNGVRYPVVASSWLFSESRIFRDEILERIENKKWKWTVYNFSTWTLFFLSKGIGEWQVKAVSTNKIEVSYHYTYYAKNLLFYPLTWLFVRVQIRGMMRKAIQGIKLQAESRETFIYS